MYSVGDTVEDFTLDSTEGSFTLSDRVKKSYVLLYFYVVNYGKTCTDYMALMNERYGEFKALNVSLVHVNPDTIENHKAWIGHTDAKFEHLFDKDQTISKMFEFIVKRAKSDKIIGNTNRAFVLIDKDMKIRYLWEAYMPMDTVPMDELLAELRKVCD